MASDKVLETDIKYCNVSDVATELLKPDSFFGEIHSPDYNRIVKFIKQAEEYIDSQSSRAWRERQRTNEYLSFRDNQFYIARSGFKFKLARRFVRELNSDNGDKLEVYDGTSWVDWLSTKQEGRDKDFWLDYENGYLYLRNFIYRGYEKVIRITYRYGEETVPMDINDITAKIVAVKLLTNEDSSFILEDAGNNQGMQYDPRISSMKHYIKMTIQNYADFGFTL
jgi:hypothetical protein